MSLSALTVFEVRVGGSDTNGGGFVTGTSGTDWSQQTAAQYAVTDAVANGTTTITSASAAFGTDVVGNIVYLVGGTGPLAEGWYQIISRASATSITLDRTVATGTGITLNIGGAFGSPGGAGKAVAAAAITGITIFIKYDASPYVVTTASTNVSGGCVLGAANTYWIGYDLSRTKYPALGGNRPTIQLGSGVSTAVIFTGTNNVYWLQNVILDCNSQTLGRAGLMSGEYFYVKAMNGSWNTTGGTLQDNSAGRAILCEVSGCTGTGGAAALRMSGAMFYCSVHDNSVAAGTSATASTNAYGCICYNNTTGHGFGAGGFINCSSYGNTQAGFFPGNSGGIYINCIAENNATQGWAGGTSRYSLINCASYNNTSGRSSAGTGQVFDIAAITGSGSFFTNAASADFTINNTAGAGALLRATGFPATSATGLAGYIDVGALQHQDTGGGVTGISRARGASGF